MMSWPQIEAIVYGEEGNPQTILGRHYISAYTLYQTFIPDVSKVSLRFVGDKKIYPMEQADEAGFYAIAFLGKELRDYFYEVTYNDGTVKEVYDPYIFNPHIDEKHYLSWIKGTSVHAYKYMGSHITTIDGIQGIVFRVWAPNAIRVSIVGDFNNWNSKAHPMMLDSKTGVFSLFIPKMKSGEKYLYDICTKGGNSYRKADPYCPYYDNDDEVNICDFQSEYIWKNDSKRPISSKDNTNEIINIFEIDNSLWNETEATQPLTKKSIDELVSYVNELGYTHVLMNFTAKRFFGVDAKLLKDNYLKQLIDALHEKSIGVIFKWNPCFFTNEENGLKCFDGTYLYGHLDERLRYNAMFGYNFNYSREGVKVFLMSDLFYFIEEYHVDGVHVDEISTILYLDYGRSNNDYVSNIYGGTENLDAIEFLKNFNSLVHSSIEGFFTSTKETCMYPNVTSPVKEDGLGFDYIWDNGFGEDYLSFIKNNDKDIHKLTDSMTYAYSENYILTISKEDVIASCDYDYERFYEGNGYFDNIAYEETEKMAVKRATLAFFMAHPGKKLFFMGQDMKNLSLKLNKLYKELPALHVLDRYTEGFEWISAWSNGNGVISFMRKGESFKDTVLVVCNFSSQMFEEYKLGVAYEGKYKLLLCSEDKLFGGEYKPSYRAIKTVDEEYDGKEATITLKLPALSVSYYSYEPYTEEEFVKIARAKALKIRKEMEKEADRVSNELEKEALNKAKVYNGLNK